jgi:hypothetical protein
MTHRVLIAVLLCLMYLTAFGSVATAQTTGVLRGHLKIISLETVKPADGSVPAVTPQTYLEYPLVVLSSDGKQQVAVTTADSQGNYRVELPPGSYVLDVQDRVRKHVRAKPAAFTVASGETVHLNMQMDTGIR